MSWQLFCSHRAAARIPIRILWCLDTGTGAGGGCARLWGEGQPAPLKLLAQILPHWPAGAESAGQLLHREPSVGCGIASLKKLKIRMRKVSLNPPSQRSVLSLRQPLRITNLTSRFLKVLGVGSLDRKV